ncbi:MAG: hypothetical protein AB1426_11900 [Bacillota bacterium]
MSKPVLKDLFTAGFAAGVTAGIAAELVDHVAFILDFAALRYVEWAGIVVFGHKPHGPGEFIIAQSLQLFFSGIVGIIFAYLLLLVTNKNLLFKGWVYAILSWFALRGLAKTCNLSMLDLDFATALANIVNVSVYGLLLASLMHWLQKRYGSGNELKAN